MELDGTQTLVFLLQWFHCLMTYRPVFLRDCVTFLHPQVGLATGIVVQFFLKVCVNV